MDGANLDAEFNDMMFEIKNNISFLENELDMMAMSCWITKLSGPACTVEEKARRNEYLSYLLYMLKRQMLHQPFVDEPPFGPLPPLNIDMVNISCHDECQSDHEETQYFSPKASTFTYETPASYYKTPGPFRASRMPSSTPVRPRYSDDVGSQKGTPLASSTPVYTSSPTDRFKTGNKKKSKDDKNRPCSICETDKTSVIERPGDAIHEFPKESVCHRRSHPPHTPAGYVEKSSEVDDQPFMPPLPGSEKADEEMNRIIGSVDKCTRLFDFIRLIAPTTCDLGHLLNYTATSEIAQFKEFVQSMFKNRMQDTEELLTKEQVKLKERYEGWEAAVLRRAQTGVKSLKRLLPNFKYEQYERDPEYLYLMLREQFSVNEDKLHPQVRGLRIKAQKKRWLTDEAERMEKENEDRMVELKELNEQLNDLSKCYNAQHKNFLTRNKCLEEKAAKLRIRFHQNQKLIDMFLDQLNTEPCDY